MITLRPVFFVYGLDISQCKTWVQDVATVFTTRGEKTVHSSSMTGPTRLHGFRDPYPKKLPLYSLHRGYIKTRFQYYLYSHRHGSRIHKNIGIMNIKSTNSLFIIVLVTFITGDGSMCFFDFLNILLNIALFYI